MQRNNSEDAQSPSIVKSLVLALKIESALLATIAIYLVALGITHDKEWAPYLGVIGFALSGSAGLFALAQGMKREKRWAVAPTILANLIALGVAKYQFEAGLYWLALPVSLLAIAILVLTFKTAKRLNS